MPAEAMMAGSIDVYRSDAWDEARQPRVAGEKPTA
jgi:hypothetical protein